MLCKVVGKSFVQEGIDKRVMVILPVKDKRTTKKLEGKE